MGRGDGGLIFIAYGVKEENSGWTNDLSIKQLSESPGSFTDARKLAGGR